MTESPVLWKGRLEGGWKNYSLVRVQQSMLLHPAPPLAWPDPHPSPGTTMPAPGFLAAEWGRVPQSHGQWGLLQGTGGFLWLAQQGQWVGRAVVGSCVRGPKSPRPPDCLLLLPRLPAKTGIIPQVVSVIKYRLITLSGY